MSTGVIVSLFVQVTGSHQEQSALHGFLMSDTTLETSFVLLGCFHEE